MKRLVIKVGTAVLTQDGQLALDRMQNLVDLIAKLKNEKNKTTGKRNTYRKCRITR